MNLVLLDASDVDADGQATVADARARHLLDVLKVSIGQIVRVGIVDGGIGEGRVLATSAESVSLACSIGPTPPRSAVDLLLALPRPKVLHRLWAQLAALGVGHIILTNAERVERHYFDTHVIDPATYRPLLLEGLQQARDTRVPTVHVHRRFRILVEDDLDQLAGDALRIVADPAASVPLSSTVHASDRARVLLAIGPEGGWNRFELDLLSAHGFTHVGLGPRTLRSDTACVALLALVHDAMRR